MKQTYYVNRKMYKELDIFFLSYFYVDNNLTIL